MRTIAFIFAIGLMSLPSAGTALDVSLDEQKPPAATGDCSHGEPQGCCCGDCRPGCSGGLAALFCSDTVFGENRVDCFLENFLAKSRRWHTPVGIGAWHWFQLDSSGRGDNGYGARFVRGTYFYYVTVDPELELSCGDKIGGHLEYEFRDADPLRRFYSRKVWSFEAYGYYQTERYGKLKAGQVLSRFGLDWHGGFWTGVSGFDGFTRDPDYGLSWERTTELNDRWTMDSYVQFFFHEDGINNSFTGADAESFANVHEQNTGIVRFVPKWNSCDGDSSLAIGVSGMAGEIRSQLPGFPDNVTSGWALDATLKHKRWTFISEVVQAFGKRSPERYVSGGPSNLLTDFFFGIEYTLGPTLYRFNYELGLDANPHGRHELFRIGTQTAVTKHVDFLIEYVKEDIWGHQAFGHIPYFHAVQLILFWHY
jgi:hypothetical protein